MAELTAGEGLAVSAPRKTFGEHAVELWRRTTRRRQRSEVVAPVAVVAEDARLEGAEVEVVAAPEPLTRETFADASAEEIIAFLKGLDLSETEGADRPEAERGELGFFGVKLTAEGKEAALALASGTPVEGAEEQIAAAVALLKAELAIPVTTDENVDATVDAADGADVAVVATVEAEGGDAVLEEVIADPQERVDADQGAGEPQVGEDENPRGE